MWIKGFSNLYMEHLEPHVLNELHTVVIDGHNLFYPMYTISKLQFVAGPECDRFAIYIKNYLEMFKRSNVKCLFLIKGGHENEEKLDVNYLNYSRRLGKDFILGQDYGGKIIKPRLLKDVFLQVLNEMEFEYAITYKNDIVEECVALASKLSCPVISLNVKYCFTSVPYIPLELGTKFDFDEDNNMKCKIYRRDKFLKDYKITKEKLTIFLLLTDTDIFDEYTFRIFYKKKIPVPFKRRYKSLLRWLHHKSEHQAVLEIFEYISDFEKLKFSMEQRKLNKKMSIVEDCKSIATQYFLDKNKVQVGNLDPLWLEKGVCFGNVALSYVILYNFRIVKDSNLIENNEEDNSALVSVDIIKYAYDLITNFNGAEIYVQITPSGDESNQKNASSIKYGHSIKKPNYTAETCVFENGWDNIKHLRLFEHFLIETFQTFNFAVLERVPADSKMLLIALVYFTRKKTVDVKSEIYSVILSYVMLAVVAEKADIINIENITNFTEKAILDSTTDKDSVTELDCKIAASIMGKYFAINDKELLDIFDRKTLHPLVEFQRCLQELNNLNTLCGSPFNPTVYSKTYSATFVYKVLYDIKNSDGMQFTKDILNPAATVLSFVLGMIEAYENIFYEY